MLSAADAHPILSLYDAGVVDLISVAPPGASIARTSRLTPQSLGKAPARYTPNGWTGFSGWVNACLSREDVANALAVDANIGLRTANWPAIDCDVSSPPLAAELRALLVAQLGDVPVRLGNAPKFAIACRAAEPFCKVVVQLFDPSLGRLGAIEFLGDGQQYVISGIHPGTRVPYRWELDNKVGGVELLTESLDRLPMLTAEMVQGQLVPIIESFASRHGLSVQATTSSAPARGVDQESLRAPSIEELRTVVSHIPNPETNWDTFVAMAAAVRAAAGPQHVQDGEEVFSDWCFRLEGGYHDAELDRQVWESVKPPHAIGFDYLVGHARVGGYNNAVNEFDAIEIGPSPTPILPTDGERISALVGISARAFLLELPAMRDGELQQRWQLIQEAASAPDPLKRFFTSTVINAASSMKTDDAQRFQVVLNARLLDKDESGVWKSYGDGDRQLMLRAAYALWANRGTLAETCSDSAGSPIVLSETLRDDLVAGFIPSRSVSALIGHSGQGKSFVAIELAGRVAKVPDVDVTGHVTAERFIGADVKHGSVLYFASEGVAGLKARANAWMAKFGPVQDLHIFASVPPLTDIGRALPFMLDAVGHINRPNAPKVALIIVDVLRAALQGDENFGDVMGAAMTTAGAIARMFDATVLLVHHSPHSDGERARGSTAFGAAMDWMGAVTKRESEISLQVIKNKDGPDRQAFKWQLVNGPLLLPIAAGQPADGGVGDVCARAVADGIRSIAGAGMTVSKSELREELRNAYPHLFGDDERGRSRGYRATRAISTATQNGWIVQKGTRYSPCPESPPMLPGGALDL